MTISYQSTRNSKEKVSASQAILQGLADDGGLYVPTELPKLKQSFEQLATASYQQIAQIVLADFLNDFTREEIEACVLGAYDEKFDTPAIAPIKQVDNKYFLELFHGPTLAFKDMALTILPYLLTTAAKKNQVDKEIVILTATSGDTGKAALEGFANVPGTKIIVFYPKDGVSPIQEKQMVTQQGDNTWVIGITGNFDDAQTKVKEIFNNNQLKQELSENGYQFSSANSINIGRLLPQVVYYVYTYAQLVKQGVVQSGEKIDVTVPTGNFGNILAAYYAKQYGVPIDRLLCASNKNNVLTDFFATGRYNRKREFFLTSSPSMDILVSSNLERLIYHLSNGDTEQTSAYMDQLQSVGEYSISETMQSNAADFLAGFCSEEDTVTQIKNVYQATGYVMDPHTAVASHVEQMIQAESPSDNISVVVSTASPFKFPKVVLTGMKGYEELSGNDFAWVAEIANLANISLPKSVSVLATAPVLHKQVVAPDKMEAAVKDILKIK